MTDLCLLRVDCRLLIWLKLLETRGRFILGRWILHFDFIVVEKGRPLTTGIVRERHIS
jgi:hypothetical protein